MKWILTIYLLSSGMYQERFISAQDCQDTLLLTHVLNGANLWTGICTGPDDEVSMRITTDIGP